MRAALLDAFGLVPGARRLLALRLGALLVCFAPARLVGAFTWDAHVGGNPRFTPGEGPLPVAQLVDGFANLNPAFLGLLGFGALSWLLLDPLLTVAAARLLARPTTTPRVWRTLWDEAWPLLLPCLRVAALSLVVGGLGAFAIDKAFGAWGTSLQAAGATAEARFVHLSLARASAATLWLSVVGALAFWTKIAVAVEGERRVRRGLRALARRLRRAPATLLPYVLVAWIAQLSGPLVLIGAGPPRSAVFASLAFLAYGALQTLLWYALIHHAARAHLRSR